MSKRIKLIDDQLQAMREDHRVAVMDGDPNDQRANLEISLRSLVNPQAMVMIHPLTKDGTLDILVRPRWLLPPTGEGWEDSNVWVDPTHATTDPGAEWVLRDLGEDKVEEYFGKYTDPNIDLQTALVLHMKAWIERDRPSLEEVVTCYTALYALMEDWKFQKLFLHQPPLKTWYQRWKYRSVYPLKAQPSYDFKPVSKKLNWKFA